MKDKIIRESIYLFDSKGFSETSIQDIVDNIGVTKGTFYYYFNSKQELLGDIHLSYILSLLNEQEAILDDDGKDIKEKLRGVIYLIISRIKTEGQNARIIFREMRNLSDVQLEEIKGKRREFRMNFQRLLEQGMEQKVLSDRLRPDILTFAILGMVNRTYYWFDPEGEVSEDELVEEYLELLLNGMNY